MTLEADEHIEVTNTQTVETEQSCSPENKIQIPNKVAVGINKDGSQDSSRIVQMTEAESKNPDFLLEAHGYDKSLWEVVSANSSIWDVQAKGNESKILHSSKVTVKPKKKEWTIEDLDKYFEAKIIINTRENYIQTNYDPDGEILEITLPDLHAGLLAYAGETQESYDIKIAKYRFNKCLSDIIERIGDRKFSKIYFVPLGDVLHVDNSNYSTNKSTVQDCDGRFTKMFNNALDLLIDAISTLSTYSKVHVPYISGNHSRVMEYALIKAIEVAFRNDDNIYIDSSPSPSKFEQFGKVLVGWSHGDAPQQNISEWLQSHAREEFGKSLYVECHTGHRHTTQTIEKSGMIIRHLPTICASSSWENQQLYNKGIKTVVSFVWNSLNGLREMWYSNI